MYKQNTSAKFKTEKGSTYTVVADGITRVQANNERHEGDGKNIFYCTYEKSEIILNTHGIKNIKFFLNSLRFDDENNTYIKIPIFTAPELGLCPVDLYLKTSGLAEEAALLHVGHKITEIL
jgi:hypothetical protein